MNKVVEPGAEDHSLEFHNLEQMLKRCPRMRPASFQLTGAARDLHSALSSSTKRYSYY
jgi:hypothetical protein